MSPEELYATRMSILAIVITVFSLFTYRMTMRSYKKAMEKNGGNGAIARAALTSVSLLALSCAVSAVVFFAPLPSLGASKSSRSGDSSSDTDAARAFDCLSSCLYSDCAQDRGQYMCTADFGECANRCHRNASSRAWDRGGGKFFDMHAVSCPVCDLDF